MPKFIKLTYISKYDGSEERILIDVNKIISIKENKFNFLENQYDEKFYNTFLITEKFEAHVKESFEEIEKMLSE